MQILTYWGYESLLLYITNFSQLHISWNITVDSLDDQIYQLSSWITSCVVSTLKVPRYTKISYCFSSSSMYIFSSKWAELCQSNFPNVHKESRPTTFMLKALDSLFVWTLSSKRIASGVKVGTLLKENINYATFSSSGLLPCIPWPESLSHMPTEWGAA